jgi:hypothetical protein
VCSSKGRKSGVDYEPPDIQDIRKRGKDENDLLAQEK